jgi:hypothetical protein
MKTLQFAFMALITVAGMAGRAVAQSEETRPVSGFNGISSGGSFTVNVKINGTESLRLKGDAADLRKIETVVENGVLRIRIPHEYQHEPIGHVDVFVTARSLSSVTLGGSGSIDVDGVVKGSTVKVSMGGSGTIRTAVESGDLNVSVAGSGNIDLTGKADDAHISVAGSGNCKGANLKVNTADISIAGSGDVRLDVEKTLSARIAGSGSILYSGNATVANVSSAGSGRVSKVR